ncbi:MAG: ROK family protein [Polyangiaceae bacterium]
MELVPQLPVNIMQQDVQGKVDSRAMREVNRSIVLDIIRRGGRVSRTDLARRSTLTKPTVSAIVEDLLARGIVQEVGFGKTVASGGRRARLLEFNDASAAYLGISLGVSGTTVALADARGEIRVRREAPPLLHGAPQSTVAALVALTQEVCDAAGQPRDRLQAVGVTVPGIVNSATGLVALASNPAWTDVPVRDMIAAALGVPVVVNNVTSAGAIAEGRTGVAKGVRSFVWAHVGSCVGAGIVIDGHVFPGTQGFAGEIGHCAVVANGPRCTCGMHGCLEALVSGPAIVRAAQAALDSAEATSLRDVTVLDAIAVAVAARSGDAVAQRIFTTVGEHLGVGVSYLVNILDPQMIVLGGGVMDAGDLLLETTRASMARHSLKGARIPVVVSALGDDAGLIGAVFAAMDQSVRSYRVVATGERVASD